MSDKESKILGIVYAVFFCFMIGYLFGIFMCKKMPERFKIVPNQTECSCVCCGGADNGNKV